MTQDTDLKTQYDKFGYVNLWGYSHGAFLIRSIQQVCDHGMHVNSMVLAGGPLDGVYEIPQCESHVEDLVCKVGADLVAPLC